MNTLKIILLTTLLTLPLLLPAQQWQEVYENDANGLRVSGSKADLLEAINSGSDVRVGWRVDKDDDEVVSIEHFAMADMVDILNADQVFAQVSVSRGHIYRKRKEVIWLDAGHRAYLFSTTDSQLMSVPTSGVGPDVVAKFKDLVSVRWFVRGGK